MGMADKLVRDRIMGDQVEGVEVVGGFVRNEGIGTGMRCQVPFQIFLRWTCS